MTQTADIDISFVDGAVQQIGQQRYAVIPLLQAIQKHYSYLPAEALAHLCQITDITPAYVDGVARKRRPSSRPFPKSLPVA